MRSFELLEGPNLCPPHQHVLTTCTHTCAKAHTHTHTHARTGTYTHAHKWHNTYTHTSTWKGGTYKSRVASPKPTARPQPKPQAHPDILRCHTPSCKVVQSDPVA